MSDISKPNNKYTDKSQIDYYVYAMTLYILAIPLIIILIAILPYEEPLAISDITTANILMLKVKKLIKPLTIIGYSQASALFTISIITLLKSKDTSEKSRAKNLLVGSIILCILMTICTQYNTIIK